MEKYVVLIYVLMVFIVIKNFKKIVKYFFAFLLSFVVSKLVFANPFQPNKGHGMMIPSFSISFLTNAATEEIDKKANFYKNFLSLFGFHGLTDRVTFVYDVSFSQMTLNTQRGFLNYKQHASKSYLDNAIAMIQIGIIRYHPIIKLSFVTGIGSPTKTYSMQGFGLKKNTFSIKSICGFEIGINVDKNTFISIETKYTVYVKKNTFNSVNTTVYFGHYFFNRSLLIMPTIIHESRIDNKRRYIKDLSFSKMNYNFLARLSENMFFGFKIFTSFKSKLLSTSRSNFKETGVGFTMFLNY